MSRSNSAAFNESIVHAADRNYEYRRGMGMIPSREWTVFYDDFVNSAASNIMSGWAGTVIDTGCTVTNGSLASGAALITSDANNEGCSNYLNKCVQLAGKKFYMEARAKLLDVSDSTFRFGLTDLVATTNPEDFWLTASADYVAFGNLDSTTPSLVTSKNGSDTASTSVTSYTLADDTFYTFAIAYNGETTPSGGGSLTAWVNGVKVATAGAAAGIPEDVLLAPYFGALGGAASDTATVDYIRFALER